MSNLILSILFLCTVMQSNESARILAYFPVASFSHQVVFRPLTQELARRGHEVIVVTTDPAFPKGQTPANLTEIDVHDISYKIWRDFLKSPKAGNSLSDSIKGISKACSEKFQKQLATDEVMSVIQDPKETFDLVIVEACYRPALVLSHVLKAPTIQISSFGSWVYNHESVGAAVHPIVYPSSQSPRIYNMTLMEKIKQFFNYISIQIAYYSMEDEDNRMLRSIFGPEVPSLSELQKNIDLLFLNVHPVWEDNRPVPTNVVYIGGMAQAQEKPLPEDLKSFLDSSKNGVIYVSFGTNVQPSMLPPEKIQAMVKVFSQLPYDVLWKWDKDELPGRSKNIRLAKWLPQPDLLKHPKIKVFVMQGGLQSTDEAIEAGVPLIGIPLGFDQYYNTEKYVLHQIGLQILIETINEQRFKDAINKIVSNDSYRRNMVRLRSLMHDQTQRPLERAVWWTEHVLRHGGGKHLRAPAANMGWVEYLELQLVFLLVTMILAFIVTIKFIVRYVKKNLLFKVKIKMS